MNILIHYYRLGHYIGGAEVVALNQCSEILRQGHNVTILTADTGHHSKIFMDFVNAQRAYKPDPSRELHNFYHRIGAQSRRAKMLERATEQQVPNIAEYRQIYQQYNQPIIQYIKPNPSVKNI